MIGEDFLCDLASNKWEKCVCLLLSRKRTMQISLSNITGRKTVITSQLSRFYFGKYL